MFDTLALISMITLIQFKKKEGIPSFQKIKQTIEIKRGKCLRGISLLSLPQKTNRFWPDRNNVSADYEI